jgi:hypothetical protein
MTDPRNLPHLILWAARTHARAHPRLASAVCAALIAVAVVGVSLLWPWWADWREWVGHWGEMPMKRVVTGAEG